MPEDFTATVTRQDFNRDPKTGNSRAVGAPIKVPGRTVPISRERFMQGERDPMTSPRSTRRAKAGR
jgi:hypothetical protein